jgi:uncharacterized membrane protein
VPQEQGTPPEPGARAATSLAGERLDAPPPEASPGPIRTKASPGPASAEATPGDAPAEATPGGAAAGSGDARPDPVAWLIALAAFGGYATISVFRYLRLDPGSWDLGIYTQYARQIAHLHAPVVTIRGPGFNLLGDHFQPIVALVAPFFRLFPTPVTLLIAQALLTAVSVVPVCRAAQARLGTGVSRVIGTAYGFSWGLQQMIIFDFHEIAFAVPLLACSLSALVRRRPRAAAVWALPLVFVKEDQGLTVAAIGLVMIAAAAWARRGRDGLARPGGLWSFWAAPAAISHHKPSCEVAGDAASGRDHAGLVGAAGAGAGTWARAGAVLVLWGPAGSALAIAVIIPHFNPAHHYLYWNDGGVIALHGGHISAGPLLAQLARGGLEKLGTTAMVLLPVAFLALRSPLVTIAVPGLALRFLATDSHFWGTRWHYSATLMPIVFVAAIDGLARIQARAARSRAQATGSRAPAAVPPLPGAIPPVPGAAAAAHRAPRAARYAAVAMAAIAAVLAFRFPLAQLWTPRTYQISPQVRADREAMARIPAGTTVESTLTTLAPLATRDTTYWIGTPGNPVPRYILFDATDSGYRRVPTDLLGFLDQLYPSVTYQTIFEADNVYVFRRTANGPRLS